MIDTALQHKQWLLIPVFWLFFFLAVSSLVDDSPTMDEQNHIGRGIGFVRTGDPRLSLEHPPLVNSLSALPLLTMPNLDVPFDHSSWQKEPPDVYWYVFADQLFWQRGNDVRQMLFLARLPIVFLTMGLALLAYRFARAYWQRPLTLLIIPLILFDPNIMTNGRYSTTDLGGTFFILLATFLLWRLWSAPTLSWGRLAAAAVGMGLAFGGKLSALSFVAIWLVMAPFYWLWPTKERRLFWFLGAGMGSIFVVWAVFGFEWGPYFFKLDSLQPLNERAGPLPTFLAGVEQILLLSGGGRLAYLNGRFSLEGFPLYFPITLAIKTPLVTLGMLLLATVFLFRRAETRYRAIFLLLPIVGYLFIVSQSSLNIGYRHLLPMLPFIYLMIAGFVAQPNRWARWSGVGTAVWLIGICLWINPHFISYFNPAIGGPINGPRWLLDSNTDWGQDLIRLERWMAENEVEAIKLGWFGTADPAYFGVQNQPMPGFPRPEYLSQWVPPPFDPANPEPGIYAISASSLWELPAPESNVYAWFRARPPDDRIGYSIWIYEVEE